ncbi:MAG: hypothetical protein M5R40_06665 [Anaerolineae bacterium]|nr:hypothetical protein [Anaerolineae bacterium]
MRRLTVFLGMMVVLALLLLRRADGAGAGGAAPEVDLTDLGTVLAWLAGAGASWAVTQLFVFVADVWPDWAALDPRLQNLLKAVLIVAVALGASWLLQQNEWIAQVQPVWAIVVSALLAGWLGERQATSRVRLVRAQEALTAQAQRRATSSRRSQAQKRKPCPEAGWGFSFDARSSTPGAPHAAQAR